MAPEYFMAHFSDVHLQVHIIVRNEKRCNYAVYIKLMCNSYGVLNVN